MFTLATLVLLSLLLCVVCVKVWHGWQWNHGMDHGMGNRRTVDRTKTTERDHALDPKHKVFLSHSGAQKNFVEQLCVDLERYNRYPFFDKRRDSLPIGAEFPHLIFNAIRQCQVGVIVVSKEFFTRTKWPMLELVAMVKSKEQNSNMVIMPIFYGISHIECRNQVNIKKWKRVWLGWSKYDSRINIKEWMDALKVFGPTNALEYDGSSEVRFRHEIVDAICKKVPPETRWDDSHIQGRSRLCEVIREKISSAKVSSTYNIQVLGLYGMGGIGKTTVCKTLCNSFYLEFGGRVSHAELESASDEEVFQNVLKRLTDTRHEFLNGLNIDQCRDHLKKNVSRQKIFLALDNVSDNENSRMQAKTYLKAGFEVGSIVLVTARSLGLLKSLNLNESDCMEMPELTTDEAKSLFLYHNTCILALKNELDEECILQCIKRCHFLKGDGKSYHYHPLALKVLAGQLSCNGYQPQVWIMQLNELDAFNQLRDKEHPIFSILRKSFDALQYDDQLLFMDVAFYIPNFQKFKSYNCNIFEWLSMVHGTTKSKVKILLEGLKRKSLLHDVHDVHDRVNTRLGMHDLWREFSEAETKVGEFERRRWVYVSKGFSALEEASPSGTCWVNMKRMCLLERKFTSIVKDVNFSYFSNITVLKLGFKSTEAVLEDCVLDLGGLKHLKSLEMIKWRNEYMDSKVIERAKVLGLSSMKNLGYLHSMNIPVCVEEIGCLTNLQVLKLAFWPKEKFASGNLCRLPDFDKLTSLRVASFQGFHLVDSISGLGSKLSNLRALEIYDCKQLRSCPGVGDIAALEELSLSECEQLKELPNLRKLTNLQKLDVDGCMSIQALLGVDELRGLQEFGAANCKNLAHLPDVRNLTNLQVLHLNGCLKLKVAPGLCDLVALDMLSVDFQWLEEWSDLHKLTKLRYLCIWGSNVSGLRSIGNSVVTLEILEIQDCKGVDELPDLQKLTRLQALRIREFCEFKDVSGLSNLSELQRLDIRDCNTLERLPDMRNLKRLTFIYVSNCGSLSDCHAVSSLSTLKELYLIGCRCLESLPDLDGLPRLGSLRLEDCGFLSLEKITPLVQLKWLCCGALPITEFPDLSNFPLLKDLDLRECGSLLSLSSTRPSTALQTLEVLGCKSLKALPDLSNSRRLQSLCLKNSGIVMSPQDIEQLKITCPEVEIIE